MALWVSIVVVTVAAKGVGLWLFSAPFGALGAWALAPLEEHTRAHGHHLELVIVMMVIPFVFCALQLWVQDSFLKGQQRGTGLRRFDPADVAAAERATRAAASPAGASRPPPHSPTAASRGSMQPLSRGSLLKDAMWGPDSHRVAADQHCPADARPGPSAERPAAARRSGAADAATVTRV
eukprot:gene16601-46700_t